MKKNKFINTVTNYSNSYLHQLVPFYFREVLPDSKIKIESMYNVDIQQMLKNVQGDLNLHVAYFYIPYSLIWRGFEKFYSGSGDATVATPKRTFDLSLNDDNDKLSYYFLPKTTTAYNQIVNMLPFRSYQKVVWDWYLQGITRYFSVDITSDNYYGTSGAEDTVTSDAVAYLPFQDDLLLQLYNEVIYGGSYTNISSPFTLETLRNALRVDKMRMLIRRFGTRVQDLFNVLFHKKQDKSKILKYNIYKLKNNVVLNTSNTSTGSSVSKFFGNYAEFVDNEMDLPDFGIVIGLYAVVLDKVIFTNNLLFDLDFDNKTNYYHYFRPELDGLGYSSLLGKNFSFDKGRDTTVLGYQEMYNNYRYESSQAYGAFKRNVEYQSDILRPEFPGNFNIIDLVIPDKSYFSHLFSQNNIGQIKFRANLKVEVEQPISKLLSASDIINDGFKVI